MAPSHRLAGQSLVCSDYCGWCAWAEAKSEAVCLEEWLDPPDLRRWWARPPSTPPPWRLSAMSLPEVNSLAKSEAAFLPAAVGH